MRYSNLPTLFVRYSNLPTLFVRYNHTDYSITATCPPYIVNNGEPVYSETAAANGRYLIGTQVTFINCHHDFILAVGSGDECLDSGEWRNRDRNTDICRGIVYNFVSQFFSLIYVKFTLVII